MTLSPRAQNTAQAVAEVPAEDCVELRRRSAPAGPPAMDQSTIPGGFWPARAGGVGPSGTGGALLAEHAFAPQFTTLREGLDYASFLFNIPAPDGVRTVVLQRGTSALSTVSASANPPRVAIQQPIGGSYSGAIAARWTGSDADPGTTLQHTVLFSPDNGATWQAVAPATEAQQLTLDTAQYPNCTSCRLKVIGTDGFQSATAISVPFAVTNLPQVASAWPPDRVTDAPIWPAVSASFRDAMDAGSISEATFTLVDSAGQGVTGSVTYSPATRTAALAPASALAYGETYTARLASTIRTAGGAPLGADFAWRFRVEQAPITYLRLPLILKNQHSPQSLRRDRQVEP